MITMMHLYGCHLYECNILQSLNTLPNGGDFGSLSTLFDHLLPESSAATSESSKGAANT